MAREPTPRGAPVAGGVGLVPPDLDPVHLAMTRHVWSSFPILGVAVVVAACAATSSRSSFTGGSAGNGAGGAASGAAGGGGNGGLSFVSSSAGGASQGLSVEPSAMQTITVSAGQATPTVTYDATLNGMPVAVGWGLDKGNVGTIPAGPSASAVFAPTGKAGGVVTILAGLNGKSVQRQVMVKLTAQQNGSNGSPAEQGQVATSVSQLTSGGGVGGVGGEGLGGAVTDMPTLAALGAPSGDGKSQGLGFLYPYDKTVWPRGILAPLLMWTWSAGDADAIAITLASKSGSFTWKGTFGRPAILAQTGGKFIRHPIPQDVWDMATNSAGGTSDPLTVSLTVAKSGKAYGPITETWTIAEGRLSGVIYYNSYGTALAHNATGAVGGNGMFGGAVLSIHVGDSGPQLVAGGNGDATACRVCHSAAANGSRLWVQRGDAFGNYDQSSAYNLGTMGATEVPLSHSSWFPGLYPDGSMALTEQAELLPLPNDATTLAATGLDAFYDLGTPAFSPDGKRAVFNPMSGASSTTQQLYAMSFDKGSLGFSQATLIADDTGQAAETRPGWPAFFPDSSSVVFHHQSAAGVDGNDQAALHTRKGARAQIAWTSLKGPQDTTPLNQLNGKDSMGVVYLPKLAAPSNLTCTADGAAMGGIDADHADDVDLNYEPTVNPVASGGYAWVVFTSRRMYGNEATIPPFCSDPRGVDLVKNITTKKLWVAAVDLSQAPGADSSHPAFYLPAQELLAGNARAFWVLDPCKADGQSCQTGDQCCHGYCEPNGPMGALVCSSAPPTNTCSGLSDKCATAADCCDPTNVCINGFCSQNTPK
jgi:hypothetical protein